MTSAAKGCPVLDERKLSVLRALVVDYVNTGEPVGSKALVDRASTRREPSHHP